MREIEFRVWDLKAGFMCNVGQIDFCVGGLHIFGPGVHLGNNKPGDEHLVLMQYTGLKDCNGVKIFEGDRILAGSKVFRDINGTVSFGEYLDSEECIHQTHTGWHVGGVPLKNLVDDGIEIIGNIYEKA